MSNADYEAILRERGFELETSDFLPRPTLGISNAAYRSVVATGRKVIDGATVVVQLQDARSVNGSAYECIARVAHPDIVGAGMFRPRPLWGTYKALSAGPKLALFLLALFMLAGVWVVMLPGILLVLLLRVGALKRLGNQRFRDLVVPRAASRFDAWGTDREHTRAALTPSRQEALLAASWFGQCEVRPGEALLERPAGYGRTDIFRELIDAAEKVSADVKGSQRPRLEAP